MNNGVYQNSDYGIVQRVLAGATHDFELLIRKFNQQLFRIGIAYLKDEDDTQDAMQSAYLKAFEKLNTFRADASFATWLIRIMINECLLLLRRKNKHITETTYEYLESHEPDGVQELINTEMKTLLENAVLTLPEKYRIVYMLRAINECSTQDTAECLNLTTENVKVRFHRARQLLKNAILKEAGETEIFSFLGQRCDIITNNVMLQIINLH